MFRIRKEMNRIKSSSFSIFFLYHASSL